jgi:hypothetical protein
VVFFSANTVQPSFQSPHLTNSQFQPSVITISTKHEFSVNKYNAAAAQPSQSSAINNYNAYNEASGTNTSAPQTPTSPSPSTSNPSANANLNQSTASTNSTGSSHNNMINSQTFSHPISANHTPPQVQQNLPIIMDQLLAFNTALHKRQLGENFDDRIQLNQNNFIGK